MTASRARRSRIAFFEHADVFEDFFPHYGVSQRAFTTTWADTANHRWVELLQREVGDVTWYSLSIDPSAASARHEVTGARVRMVRTAAAHRALWRAFYLPAPAWRWRGLYPAYATTASYLAPLSSALGRALREDRPDCVFVQDYSTGKFDVLLSRARRLGVPLVAYHSGSIPSHELGGAVRRRTLRHAALLFASSGRERDRLVDGYGVDPRRVEVVLTPIDTETFHPADRRAACRAVGLDPSRRHVLFVGRLDDRVKGVRRLLRAFAAAGSGHPDAQLVIVGDGRDRDELERAAKERCPERTAFRGWTSDRVELAAYYAASECLVLPSMSEGFPTVVGEAAACGVPAVASDVGGVRELVEPERTGWLVPPGDDRALAGALREVLADPGRARSLGRAARERAQRLVAVEAVGERLRVAMARVLHR